MRRPVSRIHLEEWAEQAACADIEDPDVFHADARTPRHLVQQARQICQHCPVQAECLAANLTEEFGIWGGMTQMERSALRRQR